MANEQPARNCFNCGGKFKDAPAATTPGADRSAALDPTNHQLRTALRGQHARAACVALTSAAFLSGLRAILMPVLVEHLPPRFNDHASPMEIRVVSLCLAAMFACTALWARREPLSAAITATLIYLAFIIPDVIVHPTLLGAGHLGKIVTILILARALSSAAMHRNVGPTAVG